MKPKPHPKRNAQPREFSFAAETFNLETQTTQDGERITREREAARAAREQQAKLQPALL